MPGLETRVSSPKWLLVPLPLPMLMLLLLLLIVVVVVGIVVGGDVV